MEAEGEPTPLVERLKADVRTRLRAVRVHELEKLDAVMVANFARELNGEVEAYNRAYRSKIEILRWIEEETIRLGLQLERVEESMSEHGLMAGVLDEAALSTMAADLCEVVCIHQGLVEGASTLGSDWYQVFPKPRIT